MGKWKVGILVDNLNLGVKAGVAKAAELGADGVQLYCTGGEMAPKAMSASARSDFRKRLADLKLMLSALCGDTFKGFFDSKTIDEQVTAAKSFIDLAADLGTKVVTTHFGRFPKDKKDPAWEMSYGALRDIGKYGQSKGVFYASETGLESPADLLEYLKKVGSPGVKVNYDPANLRYNGFDQLGGVAILKDYIVHTHAKDYKKGGPETPLGKGEVDYPKYLAELEKAGYKGFLTIEREEGANVVADVAEAVKFLRKF